MRNFYKVLSGDDRIKEKCIGGVFKDNIPSAIKYPSLLVKNTSITPAVWADNIAIEYEQNTQVTVFLRNNDDKGLGEIINDIMTKNSALFVKAQWLRDDQYNEYYFLMDFRYYAKKG